MIWYNINILHIIQVLSACNIAGDVYLFTFGTAIWTMYIIYCIIIYSVNYTQYTNNISKNINEWRYQLEADKTRIICKILQADKMYNV